MIPVMIGSVTEFSGKSLVWLGVGLKMKADGFKVGFSSHWVRCPPGWTTLLSMRTPFS